MAKHILFDKEAREALSIGVDKLAGAVRVTMGPRGRNVFFDQKYDVPLATNDGVTIAKQIELEDEFERQGAELIKVAAIKTNDAVGDGTTASIVLAQSLIHEGIRNVVAGANPMILKKGIEKASAVAADVISKVSKPITDKNDIRQIAAISSNNDEFIGNMVADAFEKVGFSGVVTVEDSQLMNTVMKYSNGIRLDNGYLSEYFVTNPNNRTAELDRPYILLVDDRIKQFKMILKVLEEVVREGASLLIIAQDVEDEALKALALNVQRGAIKAAAVKCPGYGDTRKRNTKALGFMLNAQPVVENMGIDLENCGLEICGRAERVVIEKEMTVIQNPPGADSEDVAIMSRQIRKQISETKEDYEIEKLQVSLSLLSGGIAVITVGGVSELEMFERKYRMEDAINAVYASIAEGVVPGGGKVLLLAIPAVDRLISELDGDEQTGAKILRAALEAPIKQIALNAGVDGNMVVSNLLANDDPNYGYDALALKYVDMYEAGIIDPAKVIKSALINATSAASMLLTTEAVVADVVPAEQS